MPEPEILLNLIRAARVQQEAEGLQVCSQEVLSSCFALFSWQRVLLRLLRPSCLKVLPDPVYNSKYKGNANKSARCSALKVW